MIIRTSLTCETCDQSHTVRIGIGQDSHQRHRFKCRGCGEDIVIRLDLDHARAGHAIAYEENARASREVAGAPIVNVDANFLIPEGEQGKDMVFPRLLQAQEMAERAEAAGTLVSLADIPQGALGTRPFRQSDYGNEWRQLKKAWSLKRNGREKLSKRKIAEASASLYPSDLLNDLPDWIWRLCLFITQPAFEPKFRAVMTDIQSLTEAKGFDDLAKFYSNNMATNRSTKYFNLFSEYFSAYSEFAQVQFLVTKGMGIDPSYRASSVDFDATRMFYGNAFETLGSVVDLLAYLNNLKSGRLFNEFQNLTFKQYAQLDKSARFGPFSLNPTFTALCDERDNQIRNASHHGSFELDAKSQVIHYRAGRGGTGDEQRINYSDYLARCVRLFLNIVTILRIELILCNARGLRHPV